MFNLTITGSAQDNALGKIEIDGFSEYFSTSFEYWKPPQYERHWLESVKRIKAGSNNSAFITSITDPTNSNFLRWWVCYENNDKLIFQEHILFLDELETPFDEKNPYESIPEYEEFTDDGERVSSWCCHKGDLLEFEEALIKAAHNNGLQRAG